MSLKDQIQSDYLTAYKAKDSVRLAVLRHLKTADKNLSVDLKRDLNDGELMEIIQKQAKQRVDSIEQFRAGGREDLASKEESELIILKEYLPEMLKAEELETAVSEAIVKTGAEGMRDMSKVMASLMEEYKGRLDGKAVSALVREKLA